MGPGPAAGLLLRAKYAADRVLGCRAPRLAALLDRRRPHRWARWGPALNGQEGRRRLVAEVARAVAFDAFVETGTYRGMTAEHIRTTLGLEVYSAEINPRFFAFCRWRFRHDAGVHLWFGDSRRMLRELAGDPRLREARLLVYLDAHWNDDLPLTEEVEIVASQWQKWVIVVDDFEVPDDPGYGFDDYGPGRALRLAGVPLARPGSELFFPSLPSHAETGMRRGCVVLAPCGPVADRLAEVPSLRRYPAG